MSREKWLSSLTILLVEDNKINQFLVQKLISKTGPQVHLADDGFKALEILNKEKVDIVLTDIQMPGMSGFELAKKIRNSDLDGLRDTPIIAITGYAGEEEKAAAAEAGINNFITKPFGTDELIDILERVLLKNPDQPR